MVTSISMKSSIKIFGKAGGIRIDANFRSYSSFKAVPFVLATSLLSVKDKIDVYESISL